MCSALITTILLCRRANRPEDIQRVLPIPRGVTASVGISMNDKGMASATDMLQRSDAAMYQAGIPILSSLILRLNRE